MWPSTTRTSRSCRCICRTPSSSCGTSSGCRPKNRLVIALNRFDWFGNAGPSHRCCRRRRAALRFERVEAFKTRGIDAGAKADVLNLLAIEFAENTPPGGSVILTFSGGGALRLEVECLEAELADLGPEWVAVRCPGTQNKTSRG